MFNRCFVWTMAAVGIVFIPLFAQVSQTPPMGFNSYDCLSWSATEAEMKAMADSMAKKYLSYGWEYVCIDWCWSYPGMSSVHPDQTWLNGIDGNPTPETRLKMDAYGRLMPDTVRHPSSMGGQGFKPLADYIHNKGLKFGIHIMRGIPRQAVYANTPIYGTSYHAPDAVNKNENCPWLNQMYGLNFNSPSSTAYINSIISMYAAWGIDYIKIDDLLNANVNPRTTWKTYVQAYRTAIDSTHRPIVFSTSPGATPIGDSVFMMTYANQWRMADDLWDNWNSLNNMIGLFANWYHCAYVPHYPDADMIPIGYLSERGPAGSARYSNLTRAEQLTLMTMWCIGRSPLIWGGDLRNNRLAEDSLMTNVEVIAVNQGGISPRPVGNTGTSNYPVWISDHPDSSNVKYIAIINRTTRTATVTLNLSDIGFTSCTARNLWTKTNLGSFTTSFGQSLASHASGLYKLTGPSTAVAGYASAAHRSKAAERQFIVACRRLVVPRDYKGKVPSFIVYDTKGRMVAVLRTRAGVVNLHEKCGLSDGVYILRITTSR